MKAKIIGIRYKIKIKMIKVTHKLKYEYKGKIKILYKDKQ